MSQRPHLVCDRLGVDPLQKDCFIRNRGTVVSVVMEVEGLLVVDHHYLWVVWIDSKFCIHYVITELGHHLMENLFDVHIFTLMKILDILRSMTYRWSKKREN